MGGFRRRKSVLTAAICGPVRLSAEYRAALRRYNLVTAGTATLVLVAVLLMVIKPL